MLLTKIKDVKNGRLIEGENCNCNNYKTKDFKTRDPLWRK
jgi:hypothetical protein